MLREGHTCCMVRNVRARNPLRRDPTRTGLIVKAFVAEFKKRIRLLQAGVQHFIKESDALGLKMKQPLLSVLARPAARQFQFHTDDAKLTAFNDWFKSQVEADVFSLVPEAPSWVGPWTGKYVSSAYKSGLVKAYVSTKAAVAKDLGAEQKVFLRDLLAASESTAKVKLLATRSFENLKGVTAQMGAEMNRILAAGLIDGSGPESIAKEMTERISEISDARALRIARTELVHAHAEGQLDGFTELGVENLTIYAEWSTAGDDRVCPECDAMEGKTFTLDEAHGLIPLHPNCRCVWTPAEQ